MPKNRRKSDTNRQEQRHKPRKQQGFFLLTWSVWLWQLVVRLFTGQGGTAPEPADGISEESLRRKHETTDIPVRPLLALGFVLIVIAVVLHVGLYGLFEVFRVARTETPRSPLVQTPIIPPEPRLQENPGADMARFRATEEALLNGYRVIDEQRGIVSIPITKAMDIIAERGLPAETVDGDSPDDTEAKEVVPEPGSGFYDAHDLDSEGGQALRARGTPQPLGEARPTPGLLGTPTGDQAATPTPTP